MRRLFTFTRREEETQKGYCLRTSKRGRQAQSGRRDVHANQSSSTHLHCTCITLAALLVFPLTVHPVCHRKCWRFVSGPKNLAGASRQACCTVTLGDKWQTLKVAPSPNGVRSHTALESRTRTGRDKVWARVTVKMQFSFLSELTAESMWGSMEWTCDRKPCAVLPNAWRRTVWWTGTNALNMTIDPNNHT